MPITHSFKAQYNTGNSQLNFTLGVYIFVEDGIYIAYCPALDLSGYGESEYDAKQSFGEVMRQYIEYCLHKKTLVSDLQRHGWNIKSMKQRKIKSPDTATMMKRNPDFKDIIENKEYSRYLENMAIPSLV